MSFKSPELKTAFGWKFGIMIAVFCVLQVVLPFVPLIGIPALRNLHNDFDPGFNPKQTEAAFFFRGKYYLLTKANIIYINSARGSSAIIRLNRLEDNKLKEISSLAIKDSLVTVIADERGFWLLYPEYFENYDDAGVHTTQFYKSGRFFECKSQQNEWIHQYYDYRGEWETGPITASDNNSIYVMFKCGADNAMRILHPDGSFESLEFARTLGTTAMSLKPDRLVFWQGKLWHVGILHNRAFLQTIEKGHASDWQSLGDFNASEFEVAVDKKGLLLAGIDNVTKDNVPFIREKTRLVLARIEKNLMAAAQTYDLPGQYSNILVASSGEENSRAFARGFVYSSNLLSFEITDNGPGPILDLYTGRELKVKPRYIDIIPIVAFYGTPLLLTLLLSLLVSRMMPSYREVNVTLKNGATYKYASVLSRALSQVIDGFLLVLPVVAGYFLLKNRVGTLTSHYAFGYEREWLVAVMFLGAAGAWLALALLYFAGFEGRLGYTVGKFICNIQVLGEEGRPPGFLRALLRNCLRIVDGFFNFIVGIAFIALTDNWQRLGDLAARTVVVRASLHQ